MKFSESPFVNPKIPRYRMFERERMEKAIELEFNTSEKQEKIFKDFFGLATYSVPDDILKKYTKRTEHDVQITQKELDEFTVFCKHSIKRVLNALSQKEGGVVIDLKEITEGKDEVELKDVFGFLYHDLSHVIGVIITERNKINDNSVVPPIFEFKKGMSINNREVFENELFGTFFAHISFNAQSFSSTRENFTLKIARHSATFEEFRVDYLDTMIKIIRSENYKEKIHSVVQGKIITTQQEFKEDQEKILKSIKENPPKELIRMLQYVWDHRDNPRVLVDLFFQEVGPYIEKLKQRKVYSVEKEN